MSYRSKRKKTPTKTIQSVATARTVNSVTYILATVLAIFYYIFYYRR